MKTLFPSAVEWMILACFAVLCACILPLVAESGAIIALVFPLILICMLMGARRSGKLRGSPVPSPAEQSA